MVIGWVKPCTIPASIVIFVIHWLTLSNFELFVLDLTIQNLEEVINFLKIQWVTLNHAHANMFWSSVTFISKVIKGSNGDRGEDGARSAEIRNR